MRDEAFGAKCGEANARRGGRLGEVRGNGVKRNGALVDVTAKPDFS